MVESSAPSTSALSFLLQPRLRFSASHSVFPVAWRTREADHAMHHDCRMLIAAVSATSRGHDLVKQTRLSLQCAKTDTAEQPHSNFSAERSLLEMIGATNGSQRGR